MSIQLRPATSPPPTFSWDNVPSPPPATSSTTTEPGTVWVSARDMKLFGARPLLFTSEVGVAKCKDCGKPILRSYMAEHSDNCGKISKIYKKNKEAEASKKRKASPTPDDPSQPKKKAKMNKAAPRRPKGPINLDQQCGVINDKNLPCSRSLTCKSHSMGAKRSVQGRSRGYDELLIQWQREHNPNWVEPVKRETKAEKKEKKEREKAEKKRQAEEAAIAAGLDPSTAAKKAAMAVSGAAGAPPKKQGKKAAAAAAAVRMAEAFEKEEGPENLEDLDSEAEVDDMVASIRIAGEKGLIGMPLASSCDAGSWFVQRRERVRCCRDLLLGALGGGGLGGGLGLNVNVNVNALGMGNSLRSASISSRME